MLPHEQDIGVSHASAIAKPNQAQARPFACESLRRWKIVVAIVPPPRCVYEVVLLNCSESAGRLSRPSGNVGSDSSTRGRQIVH